MVRRPDGTATHDGTLDTANGARTCLRATQRPMGHGDAAREIATSVDGVSPRKIARAHRPEGLTDESHAPATYVSRERGY